MRGKRSAITQARFFLFHSGGGDDGVEVDDE